MISGGLIRAIVVGCDECDETWTVPVTVEGNEPATSGRISCTMSIPDVSDAFPFMLHMLHAHGGEDEGFDAEGCVRAPEATSGAVEAGDVADGAERDRDRG